MPSAKNIRQYGIELQPCPAFAKPFADKPFFGSPFRRAPRLLEAAHERARDSRLDDFADYRPGLRLNRPSAGMPSPLRNPQASSVPS
jgi:hypothetical protein